MSVALCVFIFPEKPVGSVVLRKAGGYVIAEGTRFAFVDWAERSVTTAVQLDEEKPNTRFNDGKVDPAGRFFAGLLKAEFRILRLDFYSHNSVMYRSA